MLKYLVYSLCLSIAISSSVLGQTVKSKEVNDVTPKSVTASSTLNIVGPEEPIAINEEVYLRIEGLTLKEVEEAQDAQLFDLIAFPLKGLKIKASYDWMFRTLDLEFRAKHAGEYLIRMELVRLDKDDKGVITNVKLEIATITVVVKSDDNDDGDDDDNDDGDDDDDPNPPFPPLSDIKVVLMMEIDNRMEGDQGAALFAHQEELKQYLNQKNVAWEPLDNGEEEWKDYMSFLGNLSPPAVVVVDTKKNQVIDTQEFGKDATETINNLKKLGIK